MKKIVFLLIILFNIKTVSVYSLDIEDQINWDDIEKIIYDNFEDEYINSIAYDRYIFDDGSITVYFSLYASPGHYGYFSVNDLGDLKIKLQPHLPDNYKIKFQIIYPFIIIFNNKINDINNIKEAINNEMPIDIFVIHVFNNSCYGRIVEYEGREYDANRLIIFVEVIIKYFGVNSIVEM